MNKRLTQLLFVDAVDSPGIEHRMERLVPWVLHSDREYYSVLLEHHDTRHKLAQRICDPDSELSLHNMRLLIADDEIAGGFIGFSGHQLLRRREADVVDLYRDTEPHLRPELRRRFQDVLHLFAPVAPNDFYLSKIQLYPGMNGPALSHPLMEECIQRAHGAGFERIRVDVDTECEVIGDVLGENGFEVLSRGEAPIAGIEYQNMALPL